MQTEQRGVTLSRVAGSRVWQAMGLRSSSACSFAVLAPASRRLSAEEAAQRAASRQRPFLRQICSVGTDLED